MTLCNAVWFWSVSKGDTFTHLSVPAQLYSALEVLPWHNARFFLCRKRYPPLQALVEWELFTQQKVLEISWVNQDGFYQFKLTYSYGPLWLQ